MFDKLIESNSEEAEFKPRRKFFMMSSVVVGILFLSAVVFSLYAQDIDLGTDNFELAELLAPVANDAPQPEPPRQQPQQTDSQNERTELPNRPVLIAQIDHDQRAPETISTTPSKYESIPDGYFTNDPGRAESGGTGGGPSLGTGTPGGSNSAGEPTTVAEVVKAPEPPPVAKAVSKKPVSKGVVNGFAIDLPKPAYSPVARAMNLSGVVTVQVLIDESGDVVSAKAVDGHILFKPEAERAAKRAKFKPTLLSDQPVKVTGMIVYKFTK